MKKLLIATCVLSVALASAAVAAQTTYSEKVINKYTSGVVNKEKELQAKQADAKAKAEAQRKAAQDKQAAQKKAVQQKQAAQKAKVQEKKDALNKLKSW